MITREQTEKIVVIIISICTAAFVGMCILFEKKDLHDISELAKILTPVIIAFVTGYFAWGQLKISRSQKELSARQATIAGTKLKLELFDKRYVCYQLILDNLLYCLDIRLNSYYYLDPAGYEQNMRDSNGKPITLESYLRSKSDEKLDLINSYINDNTKKESELTKVRFLFNDDVYTAVRNFNNETNTLIIDLYHVISKKVYIALTLSGRSPPPDRFTDKVEMRIKEVEARREELRIKFVEKITPLLAPYLHVPEQ
ncbi:hypothetical protein HKD28_15350 [Gluconobacter sp. LMG 1744]|nr:hypothetical protein [Gluconobacter cadivus]